MRLVKVRRNGKRQHIVVDGEAATLCGYTNIKPPDPFERPVCILCIYAARRRGLDLDKLDLQAHR